MTKQEQLQQLVDHYIENDDTLYQFSVEFRGRSGWWAVPDEYRYFGDKGEYLGQNFDQAKKTLMLLFAR